MKDKTKTTEEVTYLCCISCKQYNTKEPVDSEHYRPMTLYNVILPDGKRAKACQKCAPFYKRGK